MPRCQGRRCSSAKRCGPVERRCLSAGAATSSVQGRPAQRRSSDALSARDHRRWCKVAAVSGPLVAVITGASSGIGEATARRLARELPTAGAAVAANGSAGHAAHGAGSHLVLVARREDRLRELAQTLPMPCSCLALDLTDEDAPARVLAHV